MHLILKAYKQSFSEEITFKNNSISNYENGLELSQRINDKENYMIISILLHQDFEL